MASEVQVVVTNVGTETCWLVDLGAGYEHILWVSLLLMT